MATKYNYIILSPEEPDTNVLWAKPSKDNNSLELLAFSSGKWTSLVGSEGKSAYQEAVERGFGGSFEEWIETMKGPKGATGATGATGPQGPQGEAGKSIVSITYSSETPTETLYIMTFSDDSTYALSIPKGQKGDPGKDGIDGKDGEDGQDGTSFTYEDLTEAQKAELTQDATAAAQQAAQYAQAIHEAITGLDPSQSTEDAISELHAQLVDTQTEVDALGPEIYNIVNEEWGGVLDDATTGSANANVFWNKRNPATKLSHITKIRFKAYAGKEPKLYKVTESNGSATCELIATIQNTAGGIQEYEYETDLAENEYIGISSSFYYKNGYNGDYKYSYASASGGTISTTNGGMVGIVLINESKTSRISRLETADANNKAAIKNVEVGSSYKFPTSNIGRINDYGTIVGTDTNWKYSELMYVKEGFSYVLHSLCTSNVYAVLFYTKNAGFISGIRGTSDGSTPTDLSFTIPDGAYYIRVQSLATDNDAYVINTNTLKYLQNTDEKATDAISRTEFTAGSVDRARISMSTTSTASVWFQMAPKIAKVDKIRFIAKTGTTNFFKVDLSAATAVITQIAEVENTSAEDGTIKEVAINLTLGANEYIGFNNAIRYVASGMSGFLGGYCSPTGTGIHTNTNGFACGFEAVGSVKGVVESLMGTSSKRYYTIDAEGKGDFTNIYAALKATMGKDSASNPITIIVMPGTYVTPALAPSEFFTYCSNRYLSIIGTDKVNCILRNDNGYYNSSGSQDGNLGDNSVIKLSGNVYIANLTIIATDTENASETNDYYHRSYCIHADAPVPSGGITEIHNCHLINNHAPCIGFGIYPNATLKITDCELEADFYNPSTTYGGAVIYGHDREGSTTEIEEHLIIKNCTFVSSNGHALKIINNTSSLMDASLTNNVCDVPSGKGFVNGSTTTLTKLCYGNNIADMNYSS